MPLTLDTLAPFLSDCIDALAHWSIQPGPLVTTDTTVLISKENSSTVFLFIYVCREATDTQMFSVSGDHHGDGTQIKMLLFYSSRWKEKKGEKAGGQCALVSMPLVPNLHILLTHYNPTSLNPWLTISSKKIPMQPFACRVDPSSLSTAAPVLHRQEED